MKKGKSSPHQAGVDVDAVVCRMQDNVADANVLNDCYKLLRGYLAADVSRIAEIDSAKIIRAVMNAIKVHTAHGAFQVQAHWLLFTLCEDVIPNQIHFLNEGGLEATLQVMHAHKTYQDVQIECIKVLLCTLQNPSILPNEVQNEAITRAFLTVMNTYTRKNTTDESIQGGGVAGLSIMQTRTNGWEDEDRGGELAEDCIKAVATAMCRFQDTTQMQQNGLLMLVNMSLINAERHTRAMWKHCAVTAISHCLEHVLHKTGSKLICGDVFDHHDLLERGCTAIAIMHRHSSEPHDDKDVMSVIMRCMEKCAQHQKALAGAILAVGEIAYNSETNRKRLGIRAIRLIVDGMSLHATSREVHRNGFEALSYLLGQYVSPEFVAYFTQANTMQILLHSMKAHVEEYMGQCFAIQVLGRIAYAGDVHTREAIMQAKFMERISQAIDVHKNTDEKFRPIRRAALGAITFLRDFGVPSHVHDLILKDLSEAICQIVPHYKDEPYVQLSCGVTLASTLALSKTHKPIAHLKDEILAILLRAMLVACQWKEGSHRLKMKMLRCGTGAVSVILYDATTCPGKDPMLELRRVQDVVAQCGGINALAWYLDFCMKNTDIGNWSMTVQFLVQTLAIACVYGHTQNQEACLREGALQLLFDLMVKHTEDSMMKKSLLIRAALDMAYNQPESLALAKSLGIVRYMERACEEIGSPVPDEDVQTVHICNCFIQGISPRLMLPAVPVETPMSAGMGYFHDEPEYWDCKQYDCGPAKKGPKNSGEKASDSLQTCDASAHHTINNKNINNNNHGINSTPSTAARKESRACTACGKSQEELGGIRLLKCSACTLAPRYCSAACQKISWSTHKAECKTNKKALK